MKMLLAALLLFGFLGAGLFVLITSAFARWHGPVPKLSLTDSLAWWIRETAVSFAVGPLLLFGMMPSGRPRPGSGDADRVPVLLLHGYDMNRASMWPLAAYLRARGWRWTHSVNHAAWNNPIPAHARRLADHISEMKRVTGAAQVDIVAHSMGGLVAAWYAARMDGAADIRRLVTIGTPWQGTHIAYFGRRAEARDLEPESAVLAEVHPLPVPVVSIWTPQDQIVVPATSSAIPGARLVEIELAGHLDMLFDGRVYAAVRDALLSPTPDAGATA